MLLVLVSFKICYFVKELMAQIKKKTLRGKEQSHNQQHLIQQCFPSNQGHRSIFSFVQSFKTKKKKKRCNTKHKMCLFLCRLHFLS